MTPREAYLERLLKQTEVERDYYKRMTEGWHHATLSSEAPNAVEIANVRQTLHLAGSVEVKEEDFGLHIVGTTYAGRAQNLNVGYYVSKLDLYQHKFAQAEVLRICFENVQKELEKVCANVT